MVAGTQRCSMFRGGLVDQAAVYRPNTSFVLMLFYHTNMRVHSATTTLGKIEDSVCQRCHNISVTSSRLFPPDSWLKDWRYGSGTEAGQRTRGVVGGVSCASAVRDTASLLPDAPAPAVLTSSASLTPCLSPSRFAWDRKSRPRCRARWTSLWLLGRARH